MPGAPASMQTLTASSSDGTVPPREFLSVAILLTLTESLIKGSGLRAEGVSRQAQADCVGNFLGPRRNLALILSLDHDAQERFGSGIANQETTVSSKPRFDRRDHAGHIGNRREVHLAVHTDVHQNLRVRRELRGEVGEC